MSLDMKLYRICHIVSQIKWCAWVIVVVGQGREGGLDHGAQEPEETPAMMVSLAVAEVDRAVWLLTQEQEQVSVVFSPFNIRSKYIKMNLLFLVLFSASALVCISFEFSSVSLSSAILESDSMDVLFWTVFAFNLPD